LPPGSGSGFEMQILILIQRFKHWRQKPKFTMTVFRDNYIQMVKVSSHENNAKNLSRGQRKSLIFKNNN
jgi:hypothetical protein